MLPLKIRSTTEISHPERTLNYSSELVCNYGQTLCAQKWIRLHDIRTCWGGGQEQLCGCRKTETRGGPCTRRWAVCLRVRRRCVRGRRSQKRIHSCHSVQSRADSCKQRQQQILFWNFQNRITGTQKHNCVGVLWSFVWTELCAKFARVPPGGQTCGCVQNLLTEMSATRHKTHVCAPETA